MTTAHSGDDPKARSNVLIGEEVHRLMWRSGRTQMQLAALLGVDQGSISKRLHGKREWSAIDVAVTAAWLGVEPEDLMPEVELIPDDGGDDGGAAGAPTRARTWDLRITGRNSPRKLRKTQPMLRKSQKLSADKVSCLTPPMTLQPLLEEWELWQLAARRSEVTVSERIRVIAQFGQESPNTTILHAQPIDVVRWLGRHTDWSASTAATYHSYLRAWFQWLCLMDYRADNPMIKLAAPKYPQRVPRPVSDDDLVRLLTMRMHHRTRIMVLFAALAGLRVSEVAKVRGEDLDLAKPALYVLGKGGKRAAVPLHPLLVDAALSMPRRGWWFPANARRPGEHLHSKSVSDIIGQAMRRGGVRGTPHSLRHWYGSTLLDDGADLRTVQELLRHSSVATTQIYTRVPDVRRHDAINRLNPYRAA